MSLFDWSHLDGLQWWCRFLRIVILYLSVWGHSYQFPNQDLPLDLNQLMMMWMIPRLNHEWKTLYLRVHFISCKQIRSHELDYLIFPSNSQCHLFLKMHHYQLCFIKWLLLIAFKCCYWRKDHNLDVISIKYSFQEWFLLTLMEGIQYS